MDASIDFQLQTIREATQALLQTQGQWAGLTIMVDWKDDVYQTNQTFLILPKGLTVLGSWEELKIDFETWAMLTPVPILDEESFQKLDEAGNVMVHSLLTLFGVAFLVAFAFDLIFKKVLR